MSSVLTWFKKELEFLKDSLPLIFKALGLFILIFSGLGISIILRITGFNGVIISLGGVLVEIIALIILYFFLKGYFQEVEEEKSKKMPSKRR